MKIIDKGNLSSSQEKLNSDELRVIIGGADSKTPPICPTYVLGEIIAEPCGVDICLGQLCGIQG